MVDEFAADAHDADTIGHERLGANVTARRADADPVEVPDPLLLGEARADLDEQLGLELGEPPQPAAHRARPVVLGEAGRADHVRGLPVAPPSALVVRASRRTSL